MQYGNAIGAGTALARFVGLNRTMQYGNLYNASDKDGENAV